MWSESKYFLKGYKPMLLKTVGVKKDDFTEEGLQLRLKTALEQHNNPPFLTHRLLKNCIHLYMFQSEAHKQQCLQEAQELVTKNSAFFKELRNNPNALFYNHKEENLSDQEIVLAIDKKFLGKQLGMPPFTYEDFKYCSKYIDQHSYRDPQSGRRVIVQSPDKVHIMYYGFSFITRRHNIERSLEFMLKHYPIKQDEKDHTSNIRVLNIGESHAKPKAKVAKGIPIDCTDLINQIENKLNQPLSEQVTN